MHQRRVEAHCADVVASVARASHVEKLRWRLKEDLESLIVARTYFRHPSSFEPQIKKLKILARTLMLVLSRENVE